jgi:hypothetical protein
VKPCKSLSKALLLSLLYMLFKQLSNHLTNINVRPIKPPLSSLGEYFPSEENISTSKKAG